MAPTNPYVGLAPYTEADAEWFFGREGEQRMIGHNLRAARLTLLYGASGVGKTSVLLAGVVPRLRGERVASHRAAVASAARGGDGLQVAERAPFAVAVFRDWRDPPLPALADAIGSSVTEASGASVERWEHGQSLDEALQVWASHVRKLLVILDQVEEYFLYHAAEDGPGTFAEEFPRVVNNPDLPVNFLLSLREDAWAKLDRFKERIPALQSSNYLRVEYLKRAAARAAIVRPVEEYNRHLDAGQAPVSIREDLVEAVLDDVRPGRLALAEAPAASGEQRARAASGDRVETPYLQLVMTRLWGAATRAHPPELSLTTLTSLGGAAAIVSSHLKEALNRLSAADQAIAADVFGFLVTPSKTKIAHSASDLAYWTKRDEADVRRVLTELSTGERRILRSVPPSPEERIDRYEIFHDVLAEAVLEWRTRKEQEREKAAYAARLLAEERARRKARRDRLLRRVAIVLGLAVVGLVIALVPLWLAQRDRARENQQARSVGLAASSRAQLSIDPELSVLLAMEALEVKETPAATSALAASLAASRVRATLTSGRSRACGRVCRPQLPSERGFLTPIPGDGAGLSADDPRGNRVSVSPDAKMAAVVTKGRVWLWQPETGYQRKLAGVTGARSAVVVPGGAEVLVVREDGHVVFAPIAGRAPPRVLTSRAVSATISPDGGFVATVSSDSQQAVVRRAVDGGQLRTMHGYVEGVAFSPADPGLLLVEMERHTVLWRWREQRRRELRPTGITLGRLQESPLGGIPAGFSPDGRLVATASAQGGITLWDADTGRKRYTVTPDSSTAIRAVFNQDGTRLVTVSERVATLRAATSGRLLAVLPGSAGSDTSAAFSPDGTLLATGADDGTVRVFESATGAPLMELRGHSEKIVDLEFTPDGRFLLSGGDEASARLWQVTDGPVMRDVADGVSALAFSPDGREVAVAAEAGRGLLWSLRHHRRDELAQQRGSFASTAFSPDGQLIAFSGSSYALASRAVLVVDRRTGATRRLHGAEVNVVRFSPDGRFLLTAGRGMPRLWARPSWHPRKLGRIDYGTTPRNPETLQPSGLIPETVESGAFSRDGRRVLLTTSQGVARIIDARSGLTERVFYGHFSSPGEVDRSAGDFSPDGRWVVTAGDREALVWSARTGKVRMRLEGHTGMVNSAAFSRDGRWIITAGEDQTVRVWDARRQRTVAVLRNHASAVTQAAFSPNGSAIVSGDETGVVRQYPCLPCQPLPRLRALARRWVTRELTREERAAYLGQIGA